MPCGSTKWVFYIAPINCKSIVRNHNRDHSEISFQWLITTSVRKKELETYDTNIVLEPEISDCNYDSLRLQGTLAASAQLWSYRALPISLFGQLTKCTRLRDKITNI